MSYVQKIESAVEKVRRMVTAPSAHTKEDILKAIKSATEIIAAAEKANVPMRHVLPFRKKLSDYKAMLDRIETTLPTSKAAEEKDEEATVAAQRQQQQLLEEHGITEVHESEVDPELVRALHELKPLMAAKQFTSQMQREQSQKLAEAEEHMEESVVGTARGVQHLSRAVEHNTSAANAKTTAGATLAGTAVGGIAGGPVGAVAGAGGGFLVGLFNKLLNRRTKKGARAVSAEVEAEYLSKKSSTSK